MNENKAATSRGEIEIDVRKLLMAYLKRWWLIVLCVVPCALLMLFYTQKFVTPQYRASVTIYVNNIRSDQDIEYISGANLTAAQELVNTYTRIITSRTVLNAVIEKEHLPCTYDELSRLISTAQEGETAIFRLSVTHPDPVVAARYANAIARTAPGEIETFVEGSSTKVLDFAEVPTGIYSPSYRRSFVLGGLIGLVIALAWLTILFLMDVRIKSEEDLTALSDLPLLGQIPDFTVLKRGSGYTSGDKGGRKK
ncbi:MAG: hypothetical protein IJS31_00605 [Oscillospiraceae bacterium]|nr:hypothetical protein [Oscillospiraceae bacterium]